MEKRIELLRIRRQLKMMRAEMVRAVIFILGILIMIFLTPIKEIP